MVKKALIASAVVAATSGVALANGGAFVPPPPHCVGAFYIGAAISRDIAKAKVDDSTYFVPQFDNVGPFQQSVLSGSTPFQFFSRNFDWNADGIDGELLVGYGMVFDDRYTLAAEIFGDISSDRGRFNESVTLPGFSTSFDNASLKVNDSFGVSIKPGFKISDSTNFYGSVGWVISRFKVDRGFPGNFNTFNNGFTPFTPGNFFVVNPFLTGASFDNNGRSNSRSGIQLGVGMETMVTQNVGIRGEYDWERYGNFNFSSANFNNTNGAAGNVGNFTLPVALTGNPLFPVLFQTGNVFTTHHARPTIDRYKLAVIYHFYS